MSARSTADSAGPMADPHRPRGSQGQSPLILVVDDEPIARTSLRGRLQKLGYRIMEAEDGRQGLEMARQHRPDLMIVDWMMPHVDGPTLCETIKADGDLRATQLIMMTANDQPEQIAEGLARGADDFLSKAATTQEIFARVQAGLRSHALVKQLQQARDDLDRSYQLLRHKQKELESELRSAAEFVASLLPPRGEPVRGLHLAWQFLPSLALGGDLFNVTPWDESQLGLYILDASGHGVSAALRAASLTTFLRADSLLRQVGTHDPGAIISESNRRFPLSPEGDYFTIWVARLDLKTCELTYCAAGHSGALLVRRGEPPLPLTQRALPLGFHPETVYASETIPLRGGDRLYMFSDGLFEVRSKNGECWGQDRLAATLQAMIDAPLTVSIDESVKRAREWQRHDQFRDDAALVGLELTSGALSSSTSGVSSPIREPIQL